jgi:hypothetical protein
LSGCEVEVDGFQPLIRTQEEAGVAVVPPREPKPSVAAGQAESASFACAFALQRLVLRTRKRFADCYR